MEGYIIRFAYYNDLEEKDKYLPCDGGTTYSLEELRRIVDGNIEIVNLRNNQGKTKWLMVVNEEGKLNGLPINSQATMIVNLYGIRDTIVGNVLLCRPEMIE